jgi:hypothetical protein
MTVCAASDLARNTSSAGVPAGAAGTEDRPLVAQFGTRNPVELAEATLKLRK